ncbi:hypothetical protein ACRQ5Q_14960 [Bradyrhizobium sp. PMVTL-01]
MIVWFMLGLLELALEFVLYWLPLGIALYYASLFLHAFAQLLVFYW